MIRYAQFNRERSLIKMPPNLLVTFYFDMLVVYYQWKCTNQPSDLSSLSCGNDVHSSRHASNNLPQPVEIKILMVWLINTTYFLHILKKLNLILLVTCQWITSKKYWRLWWVNTWACNTVRWYWSREFFPPIAASMFEKFKWNL